jgi:hypothetical protein
MKKASLNFWVDVITLSALLAKIWTGLLIHFVLPPGQGRAKWRLLWGMSRHDYGNIHFYLAIGMGVLVFLHIWLHWSWICSVLCDLVQLPPPHKKTQIIWGICALLFISAGCAGSLLWANTQVTVTGISGEDYTREPLSDMRSHDRISGQMTLSEAAELAGISLDEFSQKLGLPLGVNPHEQLGRLRKAHDFDIYDVRQIVSQQTTPKNTPQQ